MNDFMLKSLPVEPTEDFWMKIALLIDGYALAPALGLGDCGEFANQRHREFSETGLWRGSAIEL